MKKISLFLLGVMLAVGNSVSAMDTRGMANAKAHKVFSREEFPRGMEKRSLFKSDGSLNEKRIQEMINQVMTEKNITWDTLFDNIVYVRDDLNIMLVFAFCEDRIFKKIRKIHRNRKSLLYLAVVLEIFLDRYECLIEGRDKKTIKDRLEKGSKMNSMMVSVDFSHDVLPILRNLISYVKKAYKIVDGTVNNRTIDGIVNEIIMSLLCLR